MRSRRSSTYYPDLALRSRIVLHGARLRGLPGGGAGKVLFLTFGKDGGVEAVGDGASAGSQMAEDEFVEHLRSGCASCRKQIAERARAGEKFPLRVLQAAGVEVLN